MICENYKWLTDIYVAHRGLFNNKDIPENSLPAFEKAAENNFGIEMDVQASSDGVLMVFHDDTLDRMTGVHGKLCDFTFEQLRKLRPLDTDCQIPTFEEFLQAANGVNLVVEIKTHKNIGPTEQKVLNALATYKGNYCVESFNPFIIRWFKVHAPQVIRGTLSYSYEGAKFSKLKTWLLSQLKLCKWNGSQFIAYDATTIAQNKAIAKWSKRVPIICWTVKSQRQFEQLHNNFDNMIFDSFVPERLDLLNLNK
ncbi:MAG: glycerophosphodiester phosphodiesterase family protein [Candidatus Fimimonas sp.]